MVPELISPAKVSAPSNAPIAMDRNATAYNPASRNTLIPSVLIRRLTVSPEDRISGCVDHPKTDGEDDQETQTKHKSGKNDAAADGFAKGHARQDPDVPHNPPSFPTVSTNISSSEMRLGVMA